MFAKILRLFSDINLKIEKRFDLFDKKKWFQKYLTKDLIQRYFNQEIEKSIENTLTFISGYSLRDQLEAVNWCWRQSKLSHSELSIGIVFWKISDIKKKFSIDWISCDFDF